MNRRGIYLLPNLFTTTGLFAGFYSIVATINGQFESAAIAIFIAIVSDTFDGAIARLTNTQTNFGMEYDSLADMVSFGLAPSLMVYQYTLHEIGKLGWLAAFFYTASTALRLARFNTQSTNEAKQFFQGLPCPAAAAFLAAGIWLYEIQSYITFSNFVGLALLATVITAVLMVSNIRYYKFHINFKGHIPFFLLLLPILFLVLIAIEPPLMLFVLALIYVISGTAITLFSRHKYRLARKSQGSKKNQDKNQDT